MKIYNIVFYAGMLISVVCIIAISVIALWKPNIVDILALGGLAVVGLLVCRHGSKMTYDHYCRGIQIYRKGV